MQIAIIGGGAAGFMAAITAAEKFPEAKVTIFEKSRTVLNKVRISGGGRCNVTNKPSDLRFFIKNYPRGEKLMRKLLPQFDAEATVNWFKNRGVQLKTEPDGRMFPISDSSHTIIECFLRTAKALNIEIRTSVSVDAFWKNEHGFTLKLDEEEMQVDRLMIATGGYPKKESFDWIHTHQIQTPVPSLFTFNTPDNALIELAGVSVPDVLVRIGGSKLEWRGPLLITHWGFSGPAVLKLSAFGARDLADKEYQFNCRIDWLPEMGEQPLREALLLNKTKSTKQQIASHAWFGLPTRLWKAFVAQAGIPDTLRWGDISNKSANRLIELLKNGQFEVKGKTTFKEEFVTCGGISLEDIDPQTLQSKSIPGLFFAGEVMDVDGITGGFNFQNAWTTGFVAGSNIGL